MNAIRNRMRQTMRSDARRRGSVLLFSIIVVLLLTMMGAAYLQMARVDRRATRAVDTRSQDVEGSIIRYIAGILAADVLQSGAEHYDHPWTNSASSFPVKNYLDPSNNLSSNAQGGKEDDMWLSAGEPTFDGAGDIASWPHVSNLRGVWLDLNNLVAHPIHGTGQYPDQRATTADNDPDTGDTNLVYVADPNVMPDADGDGLGDSRWTWAPLPSQFGRTYIMGVRIIDNSALANLNVWTQTGSNLSDAARWYWPAELNLGTVFDNWTASGVYQDIMTNNRNLSANPQFDERYWFWLDAPRMGPNFYGKASDLSQWNPIGTGPTELNLGAPPAGNYQRFEIADEIELRWRHGLNKSTDNVSADPDSPLEQTARSIGAFLWRQDAVETNWNDVSGTPREFFRDEPRKHFTTLSGASLRWKTDLNAKNSTQLRRIANVAQDAAAGGPPTVGAAAAPAWTAAQFGDQFAAVVADWIDHGTKAGHRAPDNQLTRVGDRHGMEYLPFVSEAFVQATYNNGGGGAVWNRTGSTGFIIEIVNPFNTTIPLTNVNLHVDGVDWGELSAILGVNEMTPHQMLRLQHNGGLNFPTVTGAAFNGQSWPEAAGFNDIAIELLADTTSGSQIVYHRFAIKSMASSFTVVPPTGYEAEPQVVARVHALGTGNGLNAMTVREMDVHFDDLAGDQVFGVSVTAPQPFTDGKWDVAIKGVTALDSRLTDAADAGAAPQPGDEPYRIGNAGRIHRAGDIARMVIVGPTESTPFPEMWNAQTAVKDHMLDFNSTSTVGAGNNRINPASHLLSRLTTLDPDNGDAWALVPGLININTASQRMLEWALPDFAGKSTFIADVIAHRGDPSGTGFSGRTNPGFISLGELGPIDATDTLDPNEYEPDDSAGANNVDVYTLDQEDAASGLANLNQVLTTRSDVFTAYVVVRGYKSDDFSSAGLQEEYRLIAVFDRSDVTDQRPLARVLGVAVVRQP